LKTEDHTYQEKKKRKKRLFFAASVILLLLVLLYFKSNPKLTSEKDIDKLIDKPMSTNEVVDGIHVRTGLKDGEGLMTVVANCTACHSAQLIIQNKMNKERWNATIRWMQETQSLWELGDNQAVIVNYLVTNYPVIDKGRREKLEDIEWYALDE
jgi:hypothetical protein